MVINGQAVKGAKRLANHLMKDENEKVSVLEITGTAVNDNLHEALRDMEALGRLTKSQTGKVLYHANINPRAKEQLTPEQYIEAADKLMEKLGFKGQPRAIVLHEKKGRQHAHLVVQLTDVEKAKLRPISNNYYKHKEVARELEKSLKLERTAEKKTGRSYSQAEAQQAKKKNERVINHRSVVQGLYLTSEDGRHFQYQLRKNGLELAKGKRLVIVDNRGQIQSLTRALKPLVNAKHVKEKLKDIIKDIPSVEKAQSRAKEKHLDRNQEQLKGSQEKMNYQHQVFKSKKDFMTVQDRFEYNLYKYKKRKRQERLERENDGRER